MQLYFHFRNFECDFTLWSKEFIFHVHLLSIFYLDFYFPFLFGLFRGFFQFFFLSWSQFVFLPNFLTRILVSISWQMTPKKVILMNTERWNTNEHAARDTPFQKLLFIQKFTVLIFLLLIFYYQGQICSFTWWVPGWVSTTS